MDASHWYNHLSEEAKRRQPSLAKSIYKYLTPSMKSLGGGLPSADMFPIHRASFQVPYPTDQMQDKAAQTIMPIDLYTGTAENGQSSSVCLSEAQQYAAFTLNPPLERALKTLTAEVFAPPPEANHQIIGNLGNTDGLHKIYRTLLNPGDNLLLEEHCFSPPAEQARAQGCGLVPVKLDADEGLNADYMDQLLSNWNDAHGPKPRVLYTITTGQNPTGSTPSPKRLRQIYQVARKHDLVIIEDDPYYFLQYAAFGGDNASATVNDNEPLTPGAEERAAEKNAISAFAKTLSRTLLSLDVDGRVVRLDTFSKVIFPGGRTGWTTCNNVFKERMDRMSEVTTQVGAGVNQAFFAQLLTEPGEAGASNPGGWGLTGLLRWINQVRGVYTKKRDLFMEVLNRELPPSLDVTTTVSPQAGMFCWIKVNVEKHPHFKTHANSGSGSGPKTNTMEIMEHLFEKLAANNALLLPARFFSLNHQLPAGVKHTAPLLPSVDDRNNFFRATFAGKEEDIESALVIFGRVMREEFGV